MIDEVNPVEGASEEDAPVVEPVEETEEEGSKPAKKKVKNKTTKKTTKKVSKIVVESPVPAKEDFPPFKGGSLGHFNAWKGAKKNWVEGKKVDINRWQ